MNFFQSVFLKISLLTLCLYPSIALAVPIWEFDISGVEDGDAVPVASFSKGNVNALGQTITNPNNNIVKRDLFTAGSASLANAMVFSKPSGGSGSNIEYRFNGNADFEAGADFQIQFDILFHEPVDSYSGPFFDIRLTPETNSISLVQLTFYSDGEIRLNSSYDEVGQLVGGYFQWNTVHTMTLQYDGAASELRAYLDNTLLGVRSLDQGLRPDDPLGASQLRFRGNSDNAIFPDGVAIANVISSDTLSPIPEPSHAVLLVSAVVAGMVYSRKLRLF